MAAYEQLLFLKNTFSEASLSLTEPQTEQFLMYYEKLTEKNEVMNLTAITAFQDVVIRHFLDSCVLWKFIRPGSIGSVIDVGTGAGFPGVPLKILRPECSLYLLDSLQKRIFFLRELCSLLGLSDVSFEHSRAEDGARLHRECFDLAVSRAVSRLSVLSEYCLPFVKTGGLFAAYKSGEAEEEIRDSQRALSLLGGELERIEKFRLPDGSGRSLIFIRKISPTPERYPRKAGVPVRQPL